MVSEQKHLHFTEPEEAAEPYLRPDQMRDDVLILVPQAQRKHLWTRVQSIVESNANVQVDEQEVFGDVWKVCLLSTCAMHHALKFCMGYRPGNGSEAQGKTCRSEVCFLWRND